MCKSDDAASDIKVAFHIETFLHEFNYTKKFSLGTKKLKNYKLYSKLSKSLHSFEIIVKTEMPLCSLIVLASGLAEAQNDPAVVGTAIPGIPGEDYPILSAALETSFACDGKVMGYYADPEGECQQFHICVTDESGSSNSPLKFTFLCPNGTLFNQQYFICDWWFNVDCSQVCFTAIIELETYL